MKKLWEEYLEEGFISKATKIGKNIGKRKLSKIVKKSNNDLITNSEIKHILDVSRKKIIKIGDARKKLFKLHRDKKISDINYKKLDKKLLDKEASYQKYIHGYISRIERTKLLAKHNLPKHSNTKNYW